MLHGLDGTYGAGVAFILGCDASTSGILLSGFREWLIVRLGDGNNLSWPGLVLQIMNVEAVDHGAEGAPNPSIDEERLDLLFGLLDEFLEQRDERGGLTRIYGRYIEWLKAQSWFRPEMLA